MNHADAIETLATAAAVEGAAAVLGENCRNCGEPLTGAFCARCGQSVKDRSKSILKVVAEALQDFLHFDSRVLRTLAALLFMPGRMTRDYILGRRTRYVPPLRLYLFSSLVFFLVLSFANVALVVIELVKADPVDPAVAAEAAAVLDRTRQELTEAGADPATVAGVTRRAEAALDGTGTIEVRAGDATFQLPPGTSARLRFFLDLDGWKPQIRLSDMAASGTPSPLAPVDADGGTAAGPSTGDASGPDFTAGIQLDGLEALAERVLGKDWEARTLRGMATSVDHPESLNKVLGDNIAKMMFVLMPLYAVILAVLYWRRKLYFVDHLAFALHVHAFLFVLFTLIVLVREIGGLDVLETGDGAQWLLAVVAAYVWVGLRLAYRQGAIRTTVKWLLLGWSYGIVLLFGMLGVLAVSLPEV